MSHGCCVALPRGAVGLSAVCDCGVSWSFIICATDFRNRIPVCYVFYCSVSSRTLTPIFPTEVFIEVIPLARCNRFVVCVYLYLYSPITF